MREPLKSMLENLPEGSYFENGSLLLFIKIIVYIEHYVDYSNYCLFCI